MRICRIDRNNINKAPEIINLVMRPYDDVVPSDNYWVSLGFPNLEIINMN